MNNFGKLVPLVAALSVSAACGVKKENTADTVRGDTVPVTPAATAAGTMPAPSGAAKAGSATQSAATGSQAARSSGLLDPNTVTRDQLLTMPGIDAALADAIIAGHPYKDNLALDRVLSARLTADQRKAVYARLWIPIDLNTASGQEIVLIPGVGARMRHEFEEYRPYTDIARFRREIGKYVDDAEVARLERYVTIRK